LLCSWKASKRSNRFCSKTCMSIWPSTRPVKTGILINLDWAECGDRA
jgi:hypothetical protein